MKKVLNENCKIVPIMVGSLGEDLKLDKKYANLLKKYFLRKDTVFVFSTDFCHWG